MKLERLLRVPRAVRTIHLVINIPEPDAPPAAVPRSPKVTVWARTWAVLKVAGPASVATAAIIISILSFQEQSSAGRDQKLANAAAVGSIERRDAEQVSFRQNYSQRPPFYPLFVENFGTTPVYSVAFQVQVAVGTGRGKNTRITGIKSFVIYVGQIPACSTGTINIVPGVMNILRSMSIPKAFQIQANSLFNINSMYFADSNGLTWQYFTFGDLQQVASASVPPALVSGDVQTAYKNIAGCA